MSLFQKPQQKSHLTSLVLLWSKNAMLCESEGRCVPKENLGLLAEEGGVIVKEANDSCVLYTWTQWPPVLGPASLASSAFLVWDKFRTRGVQRHTGLFPEGWFAAGLSPDSVPVFGRHCLKGEVGINSSLIRAAEVWRNRGARIILNYQASKKN